jgi:hypothetical protein
MPPLRSHTVTHGRNMALQVFAAMATSASAGAAHDITLIAHPDR